MPPSDPHPAPPAPPRWGELAQVPSLGPDAVPEEASLLELDIADLWLESHSSDYVEWGHGRVAGGTIAGSSWYRPRWHDLELTSVDGASAMLQEAGLQRVRLVDCRLTGLDLAEAHVTDVSVEGGVADGLSLRQATVNRTRFHKVRLTGLDLSGTRATDVVFEDCDLTGAAFDQFRAQRVSFVDCTLDAITGVTGLAGCTLRGADPLVLAHQLAAAMRIRLEF